MGREEVALAEKLRAKGRQEELAEALGITQARVSFILRAKRRINPRLAKRIIDCYSDLEPDVVSERP